MRLPRVVAHAALIAALAMIVVPGPAGSRVPTAPGPVEISAFRKVDIDVTTLTTTTLDSDTASAGSIEIDAVLRETAVGLGAAAPRPDVRVPAAKPIVQIRWHLDNNISWYGPGFWGNGGACGMLGREGLTPETVGVAHRTLPCGTKVTFRYNGVTVTTRVIDRGPYVDGRTWDMTKGLCTLLNHCFTGGGVYWRLG